MLAWARLFFRTRQKPMIKREVAIVILSVSIANTAANVIKEHDRES